MLHGQRQSDVRSSFSQMYEGAMPSGVERWGPLADWSGDDVFAYVKANNLPLSRYYGYKPNMAECATCPASWYEGRAAYLRRRHPEHAKRYRKHLLAHAADIKGPLGDLNKELRDIGP
jgi:3'-phosphoadenosine 5'-phosphosulfate sulfotransferase (PAPS reductase)/FAD synthetase